MPKPSQGNLYMFIVIVVFILLNTAFVFLNEAGLLPGNILVRLSLGMLVFILPLLGYCIFNKSKIALMLPFKRVSLFNIAFIIMMTFSLEPLAMFLGYASSFIFPNTVGSVVWYLVMELPLPVVIIFTCVFPSIWEEVTMRGVVLGNYNDVGIRKAALVNGLFFGILHMNPHQFLYAFLMGVVFCYFVRYTQSLMPVILAHFMFNFAQIMLAWTITRQEAPAPIQAEEAVAIAGNADRLSVLLSSSIVAAIFLPVFFILFKTFVSYNKQRMFKEAMVCESTDDLIPQVDEPRVFDVWFCLIIVFYIAWVLAIF